ELAEAEATTSARSGAPSAVSESQVILQGADLEIEAAAARVTPLPDTLDVFVHGEVDEFVVYIDKTTKVRLSHRALADYIRKSGKSYQRIRLISCWSG